MERVSTWTTSFTYFENVTDITRKNTTKGKTDRSRYVTMKIS